MPREIRQVFFNEQEVRDMVRDLLASRGDERSIRKPRVELDIDAQRRPLITVHFSGLEPYDHSTLTLNGRDALSAAILYCRSRRVPLPMKAEKSLAILQGGLVLVLNSGATTARHP